MIRSYTVDDCKELSGYMAWSSTLFIDMQIIQKIKQPILIKILGPFKINPMTFLIFSIMLITYKSIMKADDQTHVFIQVLQDMTKAMTSYMY